MYERWILDRASERCSMTVALVVSKYLMTSDLVVFFDISPFVDLGFKYSNIL